MLQYHPKNPFRPVDWRWQWARTMRENKTRVNVRKLTDAHVVAALKLQARLAKCKDDVDRWTVMDELPDAYAAHMIFKRGEDEEKHPLRYVVEARILAGQDHHSIASSTGLSAGTVEHYERLFFNVSDRLGNSDFIMTCVIGPSVQAGLSDRDYDLLWKLFGYLYGPRVLDTFIKTTSRDFRPETIGEVDVALADDARSSLQRKVAVVARTFAVNPFSQSELLNIYARFLEFEKESNGGKAQDVILQNIQVMMDKLPWQSGSDAAPIAALDQYDKSNVELRTDELLNISVGNTLPPNPEIENLVFPEPKDANKNK